VAKTTKTPQPFDKRGGHSGALAHALFDSNEYQGLSLAARELMRQLARHWNGGFKPVDFGTEEAARRLGCGRKVAMAAFRELWEARFIRLAEDSQFNSRNGSKTRSWVCVWLPYKYKPPTNEWECNTPPKK
jgi:hypothetical protein